MKIEKVIKGPFVVIGKEGSTADGDGFIRKLWEDANAHFDQIAHLARRDKNGNLAGLWGAMSDATRAFLPWEDFRTGLYLAGVECADGVEAPEGWVRWTVPGFEYLRVEKETEDTFGQMLAYMRDRGIALVGAVHDFTCPAEGKDYMCFPVRRL